MAAEKFALAVCPKCDGDEENCDLCKGTGLFPIMNSLRSHFAVPFLTLYPTLEAAYKALEPRKSNAVPVA